jgi:hypothetical protein
MNAPAKDKIRIRKTGMNAKRPYQLIHERLAMPIMVDGLLSFETREQAKEALAYLEAISGTQQD